MISAWESLQFATQELVRSTPIKQRLISAYRRHLADLQEEQLPVEVRELYRRMIRSLNGVPPQRGEDCVTASVRKMSNQEADDCAALIVEISAITCRVLLNAARASAAIVQLHGLELDPASARKSADFDIPALIAAR